MSDPIVNPWFIYIASVCGDVSVISAGLIAILGLATIFSSIGLICEKDKECLAKLEWALKRILYALVVALALTIFVPSRETIIYMSVASVVTRETSASRKMKFCR